MNSFRQCDTIQKSIPAQDYGTMLEDIRETLYTLLELSPLFHSRYGVQLPRPPSRPPEPWETVIERLPRLADDESKKHIRIVYQGNIVPYQAETILDYKTLRPWWIADIAGPPKSQKTDTLNRIHRSLKSLKIFHVIFPEPRRIDLPSIGNEADYNILRTIRDVAAVFTRAAAYESGIGYPRQKGNILLFEQGPIHRILFSDMLECVGKPSKIDTVIAHVAPHIRDLDAAIVMHVPPELSLARRSKMGPERLRAFREAHARLPNRLADMTRQSNRPLILFDIDTSSLPKDLASQFLLRSIGTVIFDALKT